MFTGRLLLMLVVMTATIAVRQPALAKSPDSVAAPERTTWVQRLGSGVKSSFTRIGLMQRVTLRFPTPALSTAAGHTSRPVVPVALNPLRTCLPPPAR